MTRTLEIGTCEGKPLHVDLAELLESKVLVTASSGGGKSWILRLLLEQAGPHVQVIVLDDQGEFGSLRELLDIVLVGEGGELPATIKTAAGLMRRLLELGTSAVIDLSGLVLDKPKQQIGRRDYVRAALEVALNAPKRLWHPVIFVLDEAHLYTPEGRVVASSDAVNGLISIGRKRGYCVMLATQRLSKLHKDAAAELKNVFIGQTNLDIDQARAADTLGLIGAAGRHTLRDLDPKKGEWFCFGPALRGPHRGVLRINTGMVQTTHPRPGQWQKIAAPPPSKAIKGVLGELAELEAKPDDDPLTVEDAARRIRQLRGELAAARAAKPAEASPAAGRDAIDAAVARAIRDRDARWEAVLKPVRLRAGGLQAEFAQSFKAFRAGVEHQADRLRAFGDMVTALEGVSHLGRNGHAHKPAGTPTPEPTRRPGGAPTAPPRAPHIETGASPGQSDIAVGDGATRRLLTALAQYAPQALTRRRLAALAGVVEGGSTWRGSFSDMRKAAWVSESGDTITITDAGREALGKFQALPTGPEALDQWRQKLGTGAPRKVFDYLVAAHGAVVTREDLAAAVPCEPGGSTYRGALAELRNLGLMPLDGKLASAAELFE